ncbi:MAG TPA: hypothetical protein VEY30_07235 [Myxococcaceae bacterium]|nr:hypothetical protein [Myxococcaceae bacterium]
MRTPPLFIRLCCTTLLCAASATAQSREEAVLNNTYREPVGSVLAPVVLPSGTSAAYGRLGVPDFAVGYRQGVAGFELEGRAILNYFWASLAAEALARIPVGSAGGWEFGVPVGLGLVVNTGANYLDEDNFDYRAIRVIGGVLATYRLSDTVRPLLELEFTDDFAVSPKGAYNATLVGGGGVEMYLGNNWSGLFSTRLGWNGLKDQLGTAQSQFAFQVRLGFGVRLF